jgi:catechol 2,3-dioxygenase-like lactoylglutathione lyase family enzyme
MTETERTTHITQVGTVIVPVSDQDRALEFYVGKLGFEKRVDAPYGEGGFRHDARHGHWLPLRRLRRTGNRA